MKTILLATDFSSASINAARYAADMALAINASVLLLHVYPIPISYTYMSVADNLEEIQQGFEEKITEIKLQLISKTNSKVDVGTKVTMGNFYPELENTCEVLKPYCVVMGCQGTTAAGQFFFGSHTLHAIRNLTWPLLTVPAHASFSSIKKIGLACDLLNIAETIPLDEIIRLVNDFGAELHILNSGGKEEYDPEVVFQAGLLQEKLLKLSPEMHFITNKNIDEGILDFIKHVDIDLLMVFPKWHSLLDKLIHNSHTKQLILHSHVPVMALHH